MKSEKPSINLNEIFFLSGLPTSVFGFFIFQLLQP